MKARARSYITQLYQGQLRDGRRSEVTTEVTRVRPSGGCLLHPHVGYTLSVSVLSFVLVPVFALSSHHSVIYQHTLLLEASSTAALRSLASRIE